MSDLKNISNRAGILLVYFVCTPSLFMVRGIGQTPNLMYFSSPMGILCQTLALSVVSTKWCALISSPYLMQMVIMFPDCAS